MSAITCNVHSLQSRHLSTLAFFDVRDKQLLSSLCICVQKMDRGREKVLKEQTNSYITVYTAIFRAYNHANTCYFSTSLLRLMINKCRYVDQALPIDSKKASTELSRQQKVVKHTRMCRLVSVMLWSLQLKYLLKQIVFLF